jgi:hypothetical protein
MVKRMSAVLESHLSGCGRAFAAQGSTFAGHGSLWEGLFCWFYWDFCFADCKLEPRLHKLEL